MQKYLLKFIFQVISNLVKHFANYDKLFNYLILLNY